MLKIVVSIFSLLFGSAMLILGTGLQGTLIGLRADIESFSLTTTGIIMSSYFVGFAIGTYSCPGLIARVGHIRAYAAMATIASVSAILFAMTTHPAAWIVLRIITGYTLVGLYMIIESWLNMISPNESRGKFFNTYMLITLLATAGGQYLLLLYSPNGFELFAITSILISLALVPIALTRIRQPELIDTPKLNLAFLYRKSPQGIFGMLMSGVIVGAFYGMMPVYASKIGLTHHEIASLIAICILGGASLQWPIGLISDYYDRRIILAIISFFASLIAIIIYVTGREFIQLYYILNFIFGGFIFSLYGLSIAHVNDRIKKEQTLEATRGLMQIYGIGAITGPFLASLNMDYFGAHGIQSFFSATLLILTLFTLLRISVSEAPAEEEHSDFVAMNRTSPVALEMSPQTYD
ncbi:MAG: MFS transporter [Gammaproteobacteria bacterium]